MVCHQGSGKSLNPVEAILQVQALEDGQESLACDFSSAVGSGPVWLAEGLVDAQAGAHSPPPLSYNLSASVALGLGDVPGCQAWGVVVGWRSDICGKLV